MKRLLIAMTVLLAACQPLPTDSGRGDLSASADTAGAPATQSPTAEAQACAAKGGKMLPQGRMQTLQCMITYADAAKVCRDGDDCRGDCRINDITGMPGPNQPVSGQCQADNSRFGCYATVEGGRAQAAICVD